MTTIQPNNPLAETNMLLRAIIVLLSGGMPEPQRGNFLASVGVQVVGERPETPPTEPRSEIVEFPDRPPKVSA